MPSKSTKDKNAPKKPLSAYLLFSASERPKLKASGLDNFAEMAKALGAAWKQADAKTKSFFEKEHEKEKARYEKEMKAYESTGQPAPSSKTAQKPQTSKPPVKKKPVPVAKVEDKDEEEEDDDDNDENGDAEQSEEEEEEKPASPVKSSRKKK